MLLAKYIFSFLFSFLITVYLVPLFCALARRLHILDVPDGKVKVQNQPTPYLGGLALYCGFLSGMALTMPLQGNIFLLLSGITLLLLLGLIDDLYPLFPYQKLFGQVVASLILLKGDFYLKEHFFVDMWNIPLSLLWMLTIINGVNLIDVLDGLAAVFAFVASLGLLVVALVGGNIGASVLLLSFLGGICGFFLFNKPIAKIYLGDSGSLFIGGFLSSVPFLLSWGTYHAFGYLAIIPIFVLPLLEIFFLVILRTGKGIPFYSASRDHFAHYLQARGWKVGHILLYVSLASTISTVVALLFLYEYISLKIFILLGIFFFLGWTYMLKISDNWD